MKTKSIVVYCIIAVLMSFTMVFSTGCQTRVTTDLAPDGPSTKPLITLTPVTPPVIPLPSLIPASTFNTLPAATLSLSSPAFQDREDIPAKYTCDGRNISPPLQWTSSPPSSRSFILIVDDPDAPLKPFTHWVLFNLPENSHALPEAIPAQSGLPDGSTQGKNDFGKIGYGGPCPLLGSAHHYRFTIYAIDQPLDLAAGASRLEVLNAMQGHILAQAQLIGVFRR